jgi:hypothetical protein
MFWVALGLLGFLFKDDEDFKFEDDEDFGAIIYLLCVEFLISDSIWARLSECDGSRGCDGWVSIR